MHNPGQRKARSTPRANTKISQSQTGRFLAHRAAAASQTNLDIVVIKNWQRGAAPPTNAKRTPGYTGPVVTFVLCEHRITNDFYLQAACDEKRSIYVELVLALIDEGWAVELDQHVSDHSTWYKQSLDYESRYRTRTATPTQH